MNGSASRTCACSMPTSGPIPARNCFSWVGNLPNRRSGTFAWRCPGTWPRSRLVPACAAWSAISIGCIASTPPCHGSNSSRAVSAGSIARIVRTHCSATCGSRKRKRSWWCSTSRPCRDPRHRIGVPVPGTYREIFNSDSQYYGGSNLGNPLPIEARQAPLHQLPCSLEITLPPLAGVILKVPGSLA